MDLPTTPCLYQGYTSCLEDDTPAFNLQPARQRYACGLDVAFLICFHRLSSTVQPPMDHFEHEVMDHSHTPTYQSTPVVVCVRTSCKLRYAGSCVYALIEIKDIVPVRIIAKVGHITISDNKKTYPVLVSHTLHASYVWDNTSYITKLNDSHVSLLN